MIIAQSPLAELIWSNVTTWHLTSSMTLAAGEDAAVARSFLGEQQAFWPQTKYDIWAPFMQWSDGENLGFETLFNRDYYYFFKLACLFFSNVALIQLSRESVNSAVSYTYLSVLASPLKATMNIICWTCTRDHPQTVIIHGHRSIFFLSERFMWR